jgi:hypothetical protein
MNLRCCCGEDHSGSKHWPLVLEFVAKYGETILLTTPEGAWQVPRAFIAAHGIRGSDVPALAKKYGWESTAVA